MPTNEKPKAVDTTATNPEAPNPQDSAPKVIEVAPDKLVPFGDHVFKPYDKTKLNHLAVSIKENGIIHPLIVRRTMPSGKYEIISGHNRVAAAKLAEMSTVPVIVKELTNDEAIILANVANIESRSFATWLPSEKIKSINQYQDAIKSQGKAKDPKATSGRNGQKSEQKAEDGYARQRTAEVYGISPSKVRMFTELNRLVESLQKRLDAKQFGPTPASELAFIESDGQELINSVLAEDTDQSLYIVTIKRADALRKYFEDVVKDSLNKETEDDIKVKVRGILARAQDGTSTSRKEDEEEEPVLAQDSAKIMILVPQEECEELFPQEEPNELAKQLMKCAKYCIENNVFTEEQAL